MRECDSTSRLPIFAGLLLSTLLLTAGAQHGHAADAPGAGTGEPPPAKAYQPEEEDLKGTPYTQYGEFNEQTEEDETTRFLQYGRFFGVSVGGGATSATGNRGSLYQGGFPAFELKLHYWFDFNLALEISAAGSSHFFDTDERGHTDVSLLRLGADLKYYLPIQDLAAPITFANPYLVIGFGNIKKTDTFQDEEVIDNDSATGVTLGAGLEFVMSPRRTYFYLTGRAHFISFKDNYTTLYQTSSGIPDLTGTLTSLTAGVLFTW